MACLGPKAEILAPNGYKPTFVGVKEKSAWRGFGKPRLALVPHVYGDRFALLKPKRKKKVK
jgi:hypothetical protein